MCVGWVGRYCLTSIMGLNGRVPIPWIGGKLSLLTQDRQWVTSDKISTFSAYSDKLAMSQTKGKGEG